MMKSSEIRAKARVSLGGKIFATAWLLALVVAFIDGMASTTLGAIPVIGFAAVIILWGPIKMGIMPYFLKLARDEKPSFAVIIDGFKNDFKGNMLLGIMEQLFITLWTLLFIIPGIVKSYSYALCYYIKADHPEYGWKECIDESRRMMKGNKWRLFCLDFSFIGWQIVGMLCFGLGGYFVNPYMMTARAHFYEELKAND
jgi:uncharacterized membrane protein